MSDPNIEPDLGQADPTTLVPDMNGGATQAPAPAGTERADPAGEEGIDITEPTSPDLQAGNDLDTGAAQ